MSAYSFTLFDSENNETVRVDGFATMRAAGSSAAVSAAQKNLEVLFPQHVYRSRVRREDGETIVERGRRIGWRLFMVNAGSRGLTSVYVFVHPSSVDAGDVLKAIHDHFERSLSVSL